MLKCDRCGQTDDAPGCPRCAGTLRESENGTSDKNDGGPAFPQPKFHRIGEYEICESHIGMTLRDYFAGQAIASLLDTDISDVKQIHEGETGAAWLARNAYIVADAMMKARDA